MTHAKSPVDVAVIGAGPAGAVAARCLAWWGHSTVLFGRGTPVPALAESLPPSCLPLFDRIGIRAAVEAAGFIRATGNTVWWGVEAARPEQFPAGSLGFQVEREAFDALLVAQAAAAGARLVRGGVLDVIPATGDDGVATVRFEVGGDAAELGARWVLDCSGRTGMLAKRGWRRPERLARTLALVGLWDSPGSFALDDDTHTLVESYEGGWAWSVPVTRTRRFFTVMVDPTLTPVAGAAEFAARYETELGRTTHLGSLTRHATLVRAPWARDASPYTCASVGEPGVLLVGDAASFVDPLSSFGVKKALASAWLASVVVHTSLTDAEMCAPALELYDQRERSMYDALAQRSAALAYDAAGAHATSFWAARATGDTHDLDTDADIAALRQDAEVLVAFAEIRRRPSVRLRRGDGIREVMRPTVRDNRIVLLPHLAAPAFADGVRYLRNVDLVTLVNLAPAHDQVPALYDAYNRAAPPAPLPDFLGALSVAVGKGILTLL